MGVQYLVLVASTSSWSGLSRSSDREESAEKGFSDRSIGRKERENEKERKSNEEHPDAWISHSWGKEGGSSPLLISRSMESRLRKGSEQRLFIKGEKIPC